MRLVLSRFLRRKLQCHRRVSGFSLIEVNMAVFVMGFGVLALMALFPAGLREGMQNRADLKQTMFAQYALALAQGHAVISSPAQGLPAKLDAPGGGLPGGLDKTKVEQIADTTLQVRSMKTGSNSGDNGQYRLVVLEEANSDDCGLFTDSASVRNSTLLQVVAVQSSELSTGVFRSNPVFFAVPMAWHYKGILP